MGSLSMICTRLTYKNSWLSLSTDNSLIQEEWIIENNSKVYHNHLTQAARTMSVMFMYIECIFLRFNNWVFFNFIPETYIIIANKELYNWSRLGNIHVTYIYIYVLGKSKTIDLLEWSTIWIYTHPRICEYGGHQDHWRNWCLDPQLPCYSFPFLFFLKKQFWGSPGCSVVENLPGRDLPRRESA